MHMEADLHMEADSGGGLQYGGKFLRRVYIWRRISEAIDLVNAILYGCRGPIFLKADFGGGFYMEVDYGGGFQYGVGFLHDRGGFFRL